MFVCVINQRIEILLQIKVIACSHLPQAPTNATCDIPQWSCTLIALLSLNL